MPRPVSSLLRLLIVGNHKNHLEKILHVLRQGGFAPLHECAETPEAMCLSYQRDDWDAVLFCGGKPAFGISHALEALRASGLDLPFIVVEEKTDIPRLLDAMHAGVHDYFTVDDLSRLPSSIRIQRSEHALRRERAHAWEEWQRVRDSLEEQVEARTIRLKNLVAQLRREINEHRQSEQAGRKSEQRSRWAADRSPAAHRLSDIGTMAATVAHELRNPLGVILTATYNIRRKASDIRLEKHLVNIEKKVQESSRIINNLLHYSRLKIPQYEPVCLPALLDECLEIVQKSHGRLKVEIRRCYSLSKEERMQADPYQLREIFTNVLNNAFQSLCRKTNLIKVEVVKSGRCLTVTVQDNGCGIDKDDIHKVFEPFFTRKSKGTGLGLAICKELVELHQGAIDVHSARNQGTTVTITLPVQNKKPASSFSNNN